MQTLSSQKKTSALQSISCIWFFSTALPRFKRMLSTEYHSQSTIPPLVSTCEYVLQEHTVTAVTLMWLTSHLAYSFNWTKLYLLCSLLPPQFPQEKPVVSVYPPVGHHLVDSNNGTMISSPLLSNVRKVLCFWLWLLIGCTSFEGLGAFRFFW